jgi:DNA-directed RNA polymerase specialized sigma subunit
MRTWGAAPPIHTPKIAGKNLKYAPARAQKPTYEPMRHATDKDKAEIKRRYRSGDYPLVIAYDLNIVAEDVEKVLKVKFYPDKRFTKKYLHRDIKQARRQPITREQIALMMELYGSGKTYTEIGKILKIRRPTVYDNIKREAKRLEGLHAK